MPDEQNEQDRPDEIFIISLVSHRTQKPRVEIKLGDIRTQMSAEAAMDVAKNIAEAANGAYADAFLFNFLTEKVGQTPEVAARIMQEFRVYRQELHDEFRREQDEGRL